MVLFEYKTLFSFFVKDGREGQVMFRKKQKLYICKKRKIRNGYTHQGVLQGRLKLTCGTPFLLVRNLSDFRCYCSFALTAAVPFCGRNFDTVYCFMYGCFESMDFWVSHTFFISSLTSFTSAA